VGGVDEGHARADRRGQGLVRGLLGDAAPVGTELPGAQPDHTHGPARTPELSLLHVRQPTDARGALSRWPLYGAHQWMSTRSLTAWPPASSGWRSPWGP